MELDLEKDVKNSFVLKAYNWLSKLRIYKSSFKIIAGTLAVLTLIEHLIGFKFFLWLLVIVWIPGILYVFITGLFHFLTGRVLDKLSKKHDIHFIILREKVSEILNK